MMTHRSVLVSRARSFSRGRFVWTLALGGLLTGAQGACAQEKYLEWSDNTGRFKVDAQYLRVEGEQLVLKRVDGREIKIPFERLSPESLELARTKSGIASPKGSSPKPAPSEPKGASPGAPSKATPSNASSEKTSPESSRPVTKFQDNMDPKEFIDLVFKETSQDNYIVMWDAMPASKQKQLEELMVEFARKVDPRSFDMIRKTRNSLVEILRKQQKFILNSSVLAMPPDVRQEFEPVYPAMVDVADHLVAKELLDGKRMQQGNMRGLLDTYLTRLLKSAEKAIVALPTDNPIRSQYEDAKILNKPNWTVEKTSSTSATLSIPPAPGGPPPPPPIALVLSEGRWLPEDLVKNWDMGISQAKGFIATMNPEQIQQGITTGMFVVNAPLNSLKNAKSQEEFDKVLGDLSALVPPGIGPASLFGPPERGMPGGGPGMPGGGLGTTGSGGPSGGPQPGTPASPSGKMQKVVFEDYSFELPDRFVAGPKAPPLPPGVNIKAASWQSRNQQGDINELWAVTRVEDPKLASVPNFDPMKALQAFTKGFVSKLEGWKVQEYGDLKTRGTPSQPIHVTRTLIQMPLGEITGYSAVLKSQDHLVYVISFQYNGDVLNQSIELEKCLDTMKRN